jgi:hypothetical protein
MKELARSWQLLPSQVLCSQSGWELPGRASQPRHAKTTAGTSVFVFNSCFLPQAGFLRKTACFFALVKWRSAWRKKSREKVHARNRERAPKPLLAPRAPRPPRPAPGRTHGPRVAGAAASDAQTAKTPSWIITTLGGSAVYMGCTHSVRSSMPHLSSACRRRRLAGLEPRSRQYGTRA